MTDWSLEYELEELTKPEFTVHILETALKNKKWPDADKPTCQAA